MRIRLLVVVIIALCLIGIALFFSGCGTVSKILPTPDSVSIIPDLPNDEPPTMLAWHMRISILCYIMALVALFFKYRQEAGWLLLAAIFGPMVGRLTDMATSMAFYAMIGGVVFGLFTAWQVVKRRFAIADDGNWFTDLTTRRKQNGRRANETD